MTFIIEPSCCLTSERENCSGSIKRVQAFAPGSSKITCLLRFHTQNCLSPNLGCFPICIWLCSCMLGSEMPHQGVWWSWEMLGPRAQTQPQGWRWAVSCQARAGSCRSGHRICQPQSRRCWAQRCFPESWLYPWANNICLNLLSAAMS